MATLKHRIRRKNSAGSYDVVHFETESGLVVRPNNETVETTLTKTLRMKNAEDTVPGFHAKIDADTLQGKTVDEIINLVPNPDLSNVNAAKLEGKTVNEIIALASEATIPDSKYGFSVTVIDTSGKPVANACLNGFTDVTEDPTTLTTNSDGVAIIHSTISSVALQVANPATGYYHEQTIQNSKMGSLSSYTITVDTQSYTGDLTTLGADVKFMGKDWIVVHITDSDVVLAGKTGVSSTPYGSRTTTGYITYADSTLHQAANYYENTFTGINNFLMKSLVKSTTIKGVASKIFPATREQIVSGGFSYFNSESRRKLSSSWWLADDERTSGSQAYVINTSGDEQIISVDTYSTFRPFLTLRTV